MIAFGSSDKKDSFWMLAKAVKYNNSSNTHNHTRSS